MASTKTTVNSTWVSPRTWVTNELITSTIMNAHWRDQLNALKTPASGYGKIDEAADYTCSSTSFADVDATNMSMTMSTSGGLVFVWFLVTTFYSSGTGNYAAYFDISVDGTRHGGDDGLTATTGGDSGSTIPMGTAFVGALISGLSAGSHTFKLQWKRVTSASVVVGMAAGAGTSNKDLHPTMGAVEVA